MSPDENAKDDPPSLLEGRRPEAPDEEEQEEASPGDDIPRLHSLRVIAHRTYAGGGDGGASSTPPGRRRRRPRPGHDLDNDDDEEEEALDLCPGENWLRLVPTCCRRRRRAPPFPWSPRVDPSSASTLSQTSQNLSQTAGMMMWEATQEEEEEEEETHQEKEEEEDNLPPSSTASAKDAQKMAPSFSSSTASSSTAVKFYPSIISLMHVGRLDPGFYHGSGGPLATDCYLCLDVEDSLLTIKDMRQPPAEDEEDPPDQHDDEDPGQGPGDLLPSNPHQQKHHSPTSTSSSSSAHPPLQVYLARHGSSSLWMPSSWEVLPPRQLRRLNPLDRLCFLSTTTTRPTTTTSSSRHPGPASDQVPVTTLELVLECRYDPAIWQPDPAQLLPTTTTAADPVTSQMEDTVLTTTTESERPEPDDEEAHVVDEPDGPPLHWAAAPSDPIAWATQENASSPSVFTPAAPGASTTHPSPPAATPPTTLAAAPLPVQGFTDTTMDTGADLSHTNTRLLKRPAMGSDDEHPTSSKTDPPAPLASTPAQPAESQRSTMDRTALSSQGRGVAGVLRAMADQDEPSSAVPCSEDKIPPSEATALSTPGRDAAELLTHLVVAGDSRCPPSSTIPGEEEAPLDQGTTGDPAADAPLWMEAISTSTTVPETRTERTHASIASPAAGWTPVASGGAPSTARLGTESYPVAAAAAAASDSAPDRWSTQLSPPDAGLEDDSTVDPNDETPNAMDRPPPRTVDTPATILILQSEQSTVMDHGHPASLPRGVQPMVPSIPGSIPPEEPAAGGIGPGPDDETMEEKYRHLNPPATQDGDSPTVETAPPEKNAGETAPSDDEKIDRSEFKDDSIAPIGDTNSKPESFPTSRPSGLSNSQQQGPETFEQPARDNDAKQVPASSTPPEHSSGQTSGETNCESDQLEQTSAAKESSDLSNKKMNGGNNKLKGKTSAGARKRAWTEKDQTEGERSGKGRPSKRKRAQPMVDESVVEVAESTIASYQTPEVDDKCLTQEEPSTRRSTRTRKELLQTSDSAKSTPTGARRRLVPMSEPSTSKSDAGSLRVLITNFKASRQEKSMIAKIGGVLVDDIAEAATATHVIASDGTSSIRRTPKLMIALCRTANIVSRDWLVQSAAAKRPLPCPEFLILRDTEAEQQYDFSMRQTLDHIARNLRRGRFLLHGRSLYICPGVAGNNAPPLDELRWIVEAAGGTWWATLTPELASGLIIITSDPATNKQTSAKLVVRALKQGAIQRTTSWLFRVIIRQELDAEDVL